MDFKLNIPPRVRSDYGDTILTIAEMDMLDMYITSPYKFTDIWLMCKPSKKTKTYERQQANDFFATHEVQSYLEKRHKQITEALSPKTDVLDDDDNKELKDVLNEKDAVQLVKQLKEAVQDPNSPIHLDAIKILSNKFLAKFDVSETLTPPLRYLPVTCSICRYKIFAEKEAVDECNMCKYKKYANNNGIFYTPQEQLEEVCNKKEK